MVISNALERSESGGSVPKRKNTGTSVLSIKRSFGRKYKSDEFAKYYADKHNATLMRRASNCEISSCFDDTLFETTKEAYARMSPDF